MAQNSKDVLFKSKVNNYISEKLSQSGTPPVFSVIDVGEGSYKLSSFNGNVHLTIVGEEYVFTPLRGTPVSVPISSVTNIVVDFITLSADNSILDGVSITGSGIVNIDQYTIVSETVLSGVQPAVVSVNVVLEAQQTPRELSSFEIASPTVGRIINIIEGEVVLSSSLSMPTNTSIVVDTGATLTLTQAQNANGAVSGQGTINVVGGPFSFVDTGKSDSDGITSSGTITIALAENTLSWQYTLDGGTTWNPGTGSSFELLEGSYDKQNIQVKQFDQAGFTGNVSISTLTTSMIQLEAIDVTNGADHNPQITSIGTAGEYVVTFEGIDSEGDYSIFVQKFNADGTTTGNAMVQLEAINKTNGIDRNPQITSIGTAGEYVVTFEGIDREGDFSMFVQKFNADGTTTGNAMVQLEAIGVINGWDLHPQITSIGTAGEYVVTFMGQDSEGDYSIFVQKFNADGTTAGNAMVQLEAIGVTDGEDRNPQITSIGTAGEYVVTFEGQDSGGDYSIFVQKFNADGTAGNAMVQLEAIGVTDGEDRNPQIISIGTAGEFVVTFEGQDSGGDYSIFVQKFNADGTIAAHPQNTLKVDTTPPTIASNNPIVIEDTNNDSTGVYAAQDKILISFSEPIDASTLTLTDILLSNSHTFGEGAVLSPSSGFAATLEITLGTNPTIASGDTLTIEASKLVDIAGNANTAEIVYSVPVITNKIPPTIIFPVDDGTNGTADITGDVEDTNTQGFQSAAFTYFGGAVAGGETVTFAYKNIDNNSGTYIFQGNTEADNLVNLVGVEVEDLSGILV